jgi:hypothetical protein
MTVELIDSYIAKEPKKKKPSKCASLIGMEGILFRI